MSVDADTVRRVAHLARLAVAEDEVTGGGIADAIIANAPAREDHFFLVPKVVE